MSNSATNGSDEILRRLGIFFNQNEAMVQFYVSKFGNVINMKAIQEVRESYLEQLAEEQESEKGDDPVFSIMLECPCCREKEVVHWELRASAMSIKNDPFLAPVYFPIGQYRKLNYLTSAVAVCPSCLFASPDKKDFIQFNRSTRQTSPSQISAGILSEIRDASVRRHKMADLIKAPLNFSHSPRPLPLAVLSYQLAEDRARIEEESKNPFAIYKRASYWTRIALLQRQARQDDHEALENALQFFKEAFFRSDFPNANLEFQSCFIIFSIYLRFGLVKEAREYIGVIEQSRKQVAERNDPAALRALDQWLGMAKARWEDKDNPNLWDLPK
ncbi:MAG TPA: DUF2225 domain-containing protein [Fibrobacteraceae bacterium]|nr:DUF2225 domain-containing protein [Fibrobacteraceae bacterium]